MCYISFYRLARPWALDVSCWLPSCNKLPWNYWWVLIDFMINVEELQDHIDKKDRSGDILLGALISIELHSLWARLITSSKMTAIIQGKLKVEDDQLAVLWWMRTTPPFSCSTSTTPMFNLWKYKLEENTSLQNMKQ